MPFGLPDEAGTSELADEIAAVVDQHVVAFAERFPDVESLIAETGAGPGDEHGKQIGPAEAAETMPSINDLTLLAAAGRRDQVASLLTMLATAGVTSGRLRFWKEPHCG